MWVLEFLFIFLTFWHVLWFCKVHFEQSWIDLIQVCWCPSRTPVCAWAGGQQPLWRPSSHCSYRVCCWGHAKRAKVSGSASWCLYSANVSSHTISHTSAWQLPTFVSWMMTISDNSVLDGGGGVVVNFFLHSVTAACAEMPYAICMPIMRWQPANKSDKACC